MSDIKDARLAVIRRILEGEGESSRQQRKGAFDDAGLTEQLSGLAHKVALESRMVTDSDMATAQAAGFSEDQIFELVICAAVGQANRQYETAMAALDAATKGK
jgi:alkylhydroperoxidase/carboxymuconolactone decarboxylase family protein YurZ